MDRSLARSSRVFIQADEKPDGLNPAQWVMIEATSVLLDRIMELADLVSDHRLECATAGIDALWCVDCGWSPLPAPTSIAIYEWGFVLLQAVCQASGLTDTQITEAASATYLWGSASEFVEEYAAGFVESARDDVVLLPEWQDTDGWNRIVPMISDQLRTVGHRPIDPLLLNRLQGFS